MLSFISLVAARIACSVEEPSSSSKKERVLASRSSAKLWMTSCSDQSAMTRCISSGKRTLSERLFLLSPGIAQRNQTSPTLFAMSAASVRLVTNQETELLAFQVLDKEALRQEINSFTTWTEKRGYISCPKDVPEHLINDPSLRLPPLRGIADTPFFDRSGSLVTAAGYHEQSRIYLQFSSGFKSLSGGVASRCCSRAARPRSAAGRRLCRFPIRAGHVAAIPGAHLSHDIAALRP